MIRLLCVLGFGIFALPGCARESTKQKEGDAAPKPLVTPKPTNTDPAAMRLAGHGMPGPLTPEPGFEHGRPAAPQGSAVSVKSTGLMGELLEGNVYYFKLLSMKACGEKPDPANAPPAARRVVAAEVEVTAKEELNVSPRDVAIGVGGISFNGSVDRKRKLTGCTPLLPISVLREKQNAKGYVLFDIPVSGPGSDLTEMNLVYRPTRFGGAGPVAVQLPRD